jgi:hypothetical protein
VTVSQQNRLWHRFCGATHAESSGAHHAASSQQLEGAKPVKHL